MITARLRALMVICVMLPALTESGLPSTTDRITPIPPPPGERDAIRLPGKTANPVHEAWERMEGGLPPAAGAGVGNFGRPELWVRNVSHPTLRPFLPERSKATGSAMI